MLRGLSGLVTVFRLRLSCLRGSAHILFVFAITLLGMKQIEMSEDLGLASPSPLYSFLHHSPLHSYPHGCSLLLPA